MVGEDPSHSEILSSVGETWKPTPSLGEPLS
jgi:hypothetical protein